MVTLKEQIQNARIQLKKLHGLQWTKKRQLKAARRSMAFAQKRIHKNAVFGPEGHAGANYIPEQAVKLMNSSARIISRLNKDLNKRRLMISHLQSELQSMRNTVCKDAFFEDTKHPFQDGSYIIQGVHAVGFKDNKGEFVQEEIWINSYKRNDQGKLEMYGGSSRCFCSFDDAVLDYETDGWKKLENQEIEK